MNRIAAVDPATLRVPQGEFELERKPRTAALRAWDAADEFLLKQLDETRALARRDRLLILNDAFGALAVALANHRPYSWNDSLLAQQALRANLRANGYRAEQVRTNTGIELPRAALDCVLIKIPKSLALLEHQLFALRPLLGSATRIIGAGMARHIHSSTLERFESILGPTVSTRARKKARLILVERDDSLNGGRSRYPDSYELEVLGRCLRLINHANLFSRDRLDAGSRRLLEHMPADPSYRRIVDLGCGNGVLGIVAALANPGARLLFSDESYMALASAEANFQAAFGENRGQTTFLPKNVVCPPRNCEAEFQVADCLQGVAAESQDLVLINPPFHQQHSVGDAIAWHMLTQSRRALRIGGALQLVGNRHLGYHAKLKKIFGNCETVAADSKYVVLRATR